MVDMCTSSLRALIVAYGHMCLVSAAGKTAGVTMAADTEAEAGEGWGQDAELVLDDGQWLVGRTSVTCNTKFHE